MSHEDRSASPRPMAELRDVVQAVRALEAERLHPMPHTFHNPPRDLLAELEARRAGWSTA